MSRQGAVQSLLFFAGAVAALASSTIGLNASVRQFDKTPPVIRASAVAVDGSAISPSGWFHSSVRVTFRCSDSGSGIASCPAERLLTLQGGNQVISGTARDNAGNTATTSITVNIDLTKPTIGLTVSPAAGPGGYRTSAATAHFTCSDALSGVATCPADVVYNADGRYTASGTATDRAANSATASSAIAVDLTAPVVNISAPANGAQISADTVTITGTAQDAISGVTTISAGGQSSPVAVDGSFSIGPLALALGLNSFNVVATNGAGLSTSQALSVTRVTAPTPTAQNLVSDPQFDSSVAGFEAQDSSSAVARTTQAPLEGAASLRVSVAGYGNNVWWSHGFTGGRASRFSVSAHVRSDMASSSSLQFCAMVYFVEGDTLLRCTPVSGSLGDKGIVTAALDLDSARRLDSVRIRLIQEGGSPISFTLDAANASLVVVEAPPTDTGGGDTGGGDTGGGGGATSCVVPTTTTYPGFTYHLPTTRPFVSTSHYEQVSRTSTAYTRFKSAADSALAGNPPYNYSATHSVLMYRLTGTTAYLTDAIARVDAFVTAAEAAIAAGGVPALAGDSYLEVGWYLEQLALTYDSGYDRLTPAQRSRWAALASQSLTNVWNPNTASWGGVAHGWSGWSICDPGNNYHFSFLRATMLWALATQDTTWLSFLQAQKFGPLADYYAQLPGGGSREGTGYGTAQKNLFDNYLYWGDSTGEHLDALNSHARQTIDYWVHATVPTRDRFAPIGDQSRSSMPDLFDYHENLVHTAVVLNPGTPEARRGTWWLQNNSVNGVSQSFNLYGDLLPLPDAPQVPSALAYHATGVGAFFARSSWNTDASWVSLVAGKYDQSHAHMDQGSFTFFRNRWLAVTPNIYSHSGIHQETEVHNVLRFERADGSVIPQSASDTLASSLTYTSSVGLVTATANLTNAYWRNATSVQNWTRTVELIGATTLRVTDSCQVAAGIRPVFQIHVPSTPVLQANGSIVAGYLTVVPLQGTVVTWTAMPTGEFSQGYRLDFTSTVGCSFSFELRAQ